MHLGKELLTCPCKAMIKSDVGLMKMDPLCGSLKDIIHGYAQLWDLFT